MHYAHFNGNQMNGIIGHNDRTDVSNLSATKKNVIDPNLTKYNYNLAESLQPLKSSKFIEARIKELPNKGKLRMNINKLCDWVVQVPKEEDFDGDEKEFFELTYKFLANRYGKENVVAANVHVDEPASQSHMHFSFIPIIKREGKEVLTAKSCVPRRELKMCQVELQQFLEVNLNCTKVNLLNGATAGGNRTVQEMKNIKLSNENNRLEQRNLNLGNAIRQLPILEEEIKEKDQTIYNLRIENESLKWYQNFYKNLIKGITNDVEKIIGNWDEQIQPFLEKNFRSEVIDKFTNEIREKVYKVTGIVLGGSGRSR